MTFPPMKLCKTVLNTLASLIECKHKLYNKIIYCFEILWVLPPPTKPTQFDNFTEIEYRFSIVLSVSYGKSKLCEIRRCHNETQYLFC